jgi:hypothetical protein
MTPVTHREVAMKVHFNGKYGMVCNTNRTRLTTHRSRMTLDPAKVTCEKCKKFYNIEYWLTQPNCSIILAEVTR